MMIVKKRNHVMAIKVDLYGVDIDYMDRRSFYIYEDDEDNIKYYLDQWDAVWNNADKTHPVDMTKRY